MAVGVQVQQSYRLVPGVCSNEPMVVEVKVQQSYSLVPGVCSNGGGGSAGAVVVLHGARCLF